MIQITPQMRILVAVEPADFRRGIDGLARLCKEVLEQDPFSGSVFVFRNRRSTAVKVLVYDGQGFWLCHKRLSSGRFRWWPTRTRESQAAQTLAAQTQAAQTQAAQTQAAQTLAAHQLQVLLSAGNPAGAQGAPAWRPVGPRH